MTSILGDLRGLQRARSRRRHGQVDAASDRTRRLVTVVEPDDDMRAVLERRSPEVTALAGRGRERCRSTTRRSTRSLVSSAWHWFEQPAATNEMARVLRDGGPLFVLWNGFSRDVDVD